MSAAHARTTTAPLGIKIICVLAVIGSVLGIFGGLAAMSYGGIASVLGTVSVVVSLLYLPIVVGLWNLSAWAWTAYLVLGGIGLVMEVFTLLLGDVSAILGILIQGAILLYVYSKRSLYRSGD
jgi:hypothetical protein